MSSLRKRLLSAESDFLSAIYEGGPAVVAFSERWESLLNDLDCAMVSAELDPETAALAHVVALRCATLAEVSADLLSSVDTIHSQLMGELDSLMSDLSLDDSPSTFYQVQPTSLGHVSSVRHIQGRSPEAITSLDKPRSRKRRRESSAATSRPSKRTCVPDEPFVNPSLSNSLSTCLPFASLSSSFVHAPTTPTTTSEVSSSSSSPRKATKRKRRVSDADATTPPLGFKRLRAGPRLHAVSDSYLFHHAPDTDVQLGSSMDASTPVVGRGQSDMGASVFVDLSPLLASSFVPIADPHTEPVQLNHTQPLLSSGVTSPEAGDLDDFLRSILEEGHESYIPTSPHEPRREEGSVCGSWWQCDGLLSPETSPSSPSSRSSNSSSTSPSCPPTPPQLWAPLEDLCKFELTNLPELSPITWPCVSDCDSWLFDAPSGQAPETTTAFLPEAVPEVRVKSCASALVTLDPLPLELSSNTAFTASNSFELVDGTRLAPSL